MTKWKTSRLLPATPPLADMDVPGEHVPGLRCHRSISLPQVRTRPVVERLHKTSDSTWNISDLGYFPIDTNDPRVKQLRTPFTFKVEHKFLENHITRVSQEVHT